MKFRYKYFFVSIALCLCLLSCGDEGIENTLRDLEAAAPAALPDVGPVPENIKEIIWGRDVDTLLVELEEALEEDRDILAKHLIHQICLRREQEAYYTKYISAGGVAIMGNGYIKDPFFYAARDIVLGMTQKRPELRALLTPSRENRPGAMQIDGVHDVTGRTTPRGNFRMILVDGQQEGTVIPEIHLGNGTIQYPVIGLGGLSATYGWAFMPRLNDGSFAPDIFIHEFAHAIHTAIELLDTNFDARLEAAYQSALENGSYFGNSPAYYSLSTKWEYWADSVEEWFVDLANPRRQLHDVFLRKDPLMYALLAEWFDLINLDAVGSRVYE